MTGQHILVVEDEFLIAADTTEVLTALGYRVIGPATTLADGMAMAERHCCDAALLDVNLTSGTSRPLAEMLKENRVPFAYITGYDASILDTGFPAAPVATKPVSERELANLLQKLLPEVCEGGERR